MEELDMVKANNLAGIDLFTYALQINIHLSLGNGY
jgi:hypothetical protein